MLKTKVLGMCGRNIQTANTETDRRVTEQVSDFIYLGNMSSELKKILIRSHKHTTN
jgi:hypothetical protein